MWSLKDKNMKIYNIDHSYTDFLSKYDQRIPSEHDYHSRPFIGILISNENIDYVVSLTSPKPKHLKMKNNIDFLKIDGGKLGAINFNNMFPIIDNPSLYIDVVEQYKQKDTFTKEDEQYLNLLNNQATWINKEENKKKILKNASKLYDLYSSGKLANSIKNRCCDFKKLESIYTLYSI